MRPTLTLSLAFYLLLCLVAPASARAEEEPAHVGRWAWGFRAGAEIFVGTTADHPVRLDSGATDTLFPGPNVTAFAEWTWTPHVRLGFEAGAQVAAAGEGAEFERDLTTVVWGPTVRATLFPEGISPYCLAAAQIYHSVASGDLEVFEQAAGFSYALGGGIEFPIVARWYSAGLEGRYRQFLQGGTDPKILEILLLTHIWLD